MKQSKTLVSLQLTFAWEFRLAAQSIPWKTCVRFRGIDLETINSTQHVIGSDSTVRMVWGGINCQITQNRTKIDSKGDLGCTFPILHSCTCMFKVLLGPGLHLFEMLQDAATLPACLII